MTLAKRKGLRNIQLRGGSGIDKLKTKDIKLKLYLEGINFPIHSININERLGTYPTGFITVPSSNSVLSVDSRTLVHVFYKTAHKQPQQYEKESNLHHCYFYSYNLCK